MKRTCSPATKRSNAARTAASVIVLAVSPRVPRTRPYGPIQALPYRLGLVNPFGVDRHSQNPHRALSDAIVTAALFVELTKRATWPDLVRWSAEPAHTRLPMGKHRGQRFDEVPEDYLRWIVEGRNELREEIKASARYWLEKRTVNGVPAAVAPPHQG